ncbi:MAG: oxidoreductase [Candidatus Wildermuthbacteria bacterium RIFCSPLOWO2_02_FULL_47_10]|uniref:Oxidoreductase n=1 Tax=Candidatus Wildermuthbacteria bacterium RIFCSPHIGHO2_02_FULL_47_17 TaxID=1802452 RepID=A0A1G2R7T2_9BACT|nr:MAG: oxidoreductase [Candidatus Wildermuthbacteria bacterium RIFCSPHIGHO2_02_FULL_47_17]OHA75696.1 MAG: oxidoreductase [Candidatus Wildermuthbacteria bacterium RIFCSPLOWO2_02_FULL_47_10]
MYCTIKKMNEIARVKVLKVRHLTDSTFVLRVERKGFEFIPGQCVNIGLTDEAVNREYSTYSGINDKYLEFLIKEVTGGIVSPALKKLKKGNGVSVDGAYGLFIIPKPEAKQKYLFIGSGTGIAPFHSFVKSYPGLDYTLLHGIRTGDEQYDRKDYDPKRYVACVSRERKGGFHGRVTDYLRKHPVNPKTVCYLCGNSEMINEVYDILRSQGVNGTNIITEVFF